jgi:hypothetical protein
MGAPIIPDLLELERWLVREGLTPQQASDRYAARGEHVSAGTIRVARHRHNWPRTKMDHAALIPWKIQPEHRRTYEHRMLELESQRRQGKKLAAKWEQMLDRWLQRLQEANAVIHYHPTTICPDTGKAPGWWHVTRRPGVDFDIISMPDLNDESQVARLRPAAVAILRRISAR